jgi:RNA-splicing ligase RtcB
MGFSPVDSFSCPHNFIDAERMILRKGSISARVGERVIIPLNMRDGAIIGEGLGNPDWNFSAPHGAGRIMSRSQAFKQINMADFAQSMNGIYSETVTETTKDECPMVYKPMAEILGNITDTVEVVNIIKPIFNFKASE